MIGFLILALLYIQVGIFTWFYYVKTWERKCKGFVVGLLWPLYWNYRLLRAMASIVTEK